MRLLTTVAALSLAGTVLLSLLPEGGMKRTAGLALGLLTMLCWAEGISALLQIDLGTDFPSSVFSTTTTSLTSACHDAITSLQEALP